jgi:iron complex outermembrane receptor protein
MRHALATALLLAFAAPGHAAEPKAKDLADLSLEDLGRIEITSVSRHAERLSDAAASVFVITGEDIRRAGANSLPEALRLAPNLQVARVNANSYAISARGFNSTTANKLLVLIDGRAVYTPLFSGVFWDAQDTFLEDVERIEVISGPGATLWGANAVNGVINVITRRASETQGGLVFGSAGSLERGAGIRHGGTLDGGGSYRVYGKYFDGGNTRRANGVTASDAWDKGQVGFRTDWGSATNGFTLQGDAYKGTLDQAGPSDSRISGANLIARWNRDLADGGHLQFQGYFDNTQREIPSSFKETLNTFDVEFQHRLRALGSHTLTWGGGHRRADDRVTNSAALAFLPANYRLRWTNLFVQDDIALEGDRLRLIVGAKLESNVYSGIDFLPSARLAWKLDPAHLVWGAVSRAVRAPSRIDRGLFAPARPPFLLAGGPNFASEIANTFELGYRAQPSPRVTYSVTAFHSIYDKLRSIEPAAGGAVLANKMEATSTGIETWGSFQAARSWRLSAGAVLLKQKRHFKSGSADTNLAGAGNDPERQWMLRSSHELPGRTELDVMLRHVGPLPNPKVPAYTALDLRYGWWVQKNLNIALVGQNLFDRRHPEFGASATRSEIERSLSLRLGWSY